MGEIRYFHVSSYTNIAALPFHGGVTNTGEALFEAVRVLERERPQRVAVITMTDGYRCILFANPLPSVVCEILFIELAKCSAI